MLSENTAVLIIYDYFYPGYRAGGPIQSLANLAVLLNKNYKVYVITSDRDLLGKESYQGIIVNKWNKVNLPGSIDNIDIFYTDKTLDKKGYVKVIKEAAPAVIYFNNIYSYYFFRLPLSLIKSIAGKYKIVVCPRGMLQQGALAVKPFKKKFYLNYLRYAGLLKQANWHATNEEEARDIKIYFPVNKEISIALNIPKSPLSAVSYPVKKSGSLRLIFLSLIAEKKNLLLLLQVMKAAEANIVLHIYGPVTDENYWHQCQLLINQMPQKVQYSGEVFPAQVQQLLSQYHALILLTKGENFGHAIYESLSAGRPVITSYFTPWNNLQQKKAGANADISDMNDCLKTLSLFTKMDQDNYNTYCKGAHTMAITYYENLNAEESYRKLFHVGDRRQEIVG